MIRATSLALVVVGVAFGSVVPAAGQPTAAIGRPEAADVLPGVATQPDTFRPFLRVGKALPAAQVVPPPEWPFVPRRTPRNDRPRCLMPVLPADPSLDRQMVVDVDAAITYAMPTLDVGCEP